MVKRILSIDLSTKLIGIAVFQEDGGVYKLVDSIQSNLVRDKTYTLSDQLNELHYELEEWICKWDPQSIATERPTAFGNGLKVAYAVGVLYERCGEHQIPVKEYSPMTVKKQFTGSGKATKEDIIAHAIKLFPTEDIQNGDIKCRREYDRADAIAIGYTHIKMELKKDVL